MECGAEGRFMVLDAPRVWWLSVEEGRLTLRPHWASLLYAVVMREHSYARDEVVIRDWVPFPTMKAPWRRGHVFTVRRPDESTKLVEFSSPSSYALVAAALREA